MISNETILQREHKRFVVLPIKIVFRRNGIFVNKTFTATVGIAVILLVA
jgi:hypothetical protein